MKLSFLQTIGEMDFHLPLNKYIFHLFYAF